MLNKKSLAQLALIFSDAELIDIDASDWDRGIALLVLADHVRRTIPGQLELLAVRFHGVRRFDCSFHHHGRVFGNRVPEHWNWRIYKSHVVEGRTMELRLEGSDEAPVLEIECADVTVEMAAWRLFQDLNPDCEKFGTGFARPGIERLHDLLRGSWPARETTPVASAPGTPTDDRLARLERIFSDAVVVDVDASRWDGVITLYVFADHDPAGTPGKLALLAVRFREVRRFQWAFPHHRHFEEQGLELKANRHLKWVVDRIGIVPGEIGEVTLAGGELSPTLEIAFRDVEIEPVSWRIFADVDPDWNAPWTGFARPGIERLHALMTGSLKPATPATAPGHRPSMAMLKGEAPATRAQ